MFCKNSLEIAERGRNLEMSAKHVLIVFNIYIELGHSVLLSKLIGYILSIQATFCA